MVHDIIIKSHQLVQENHGITQDIRTSTQKTDGDVEELREKVEEILLRQKSLQSTLDAISGQNGLFVFLSEYLSECY